MSQLDKIHIVHAPLSNRINLARFGKDPTVALESKDAMGQFLMVLCSYMFDAKMPDVGASNAITFGGGDEQFKLTLERINQ